MQATENKANKIWLAVLSVGVVIALILGIVALVNHGDTKANAIPTINQQVDSIKNTLPELEKVSTELKGYIDTLETTAEKLQSDLTAVGTALDDLETEIYGKVDAEKTATLNQLKADKTKLEGEIDDIEDRLKKIEKESLTTIDQQITAINGSIDDLKEVDAQLDGYIKSLQATAANLQSQLDATNEKIDSVKKELSDEIDDLEKNLLNELNNLKTDIEGQLATINNAIVALQAKDAELDQKIMNLHTYVDSEIAFTQEELDEVKQELATVQSEMATMKTAIEDLQKRMTDIEGDVSSLQTAVADLESRIADLEELFNQIQSVTFIPQYSDGKVLLDYESGTTSLDFMINPQKLNTALVEAWKNNKDTENSIIKAYVRYTNDPVTRVNTRAVATPIELTVADVTASDGGFISITVEDNVSLLSKNFWLGEQEAVVYIVISDGVTEIASEAIPMVAHRYAAASFSINGFASDDDNGQYIVRE